MPDAEPAAAREAGRAAPGADDEWALAQGSPYWWRRPSVSVVVVTHNEGANLRRTLHDLLGTLPGNSEVVVVDDLSSDGSVDFLGPGYPAVRVVRPPRRLGVSGARNLGGRHAMGDVLVFSDAHLELPPHWLDPLVAALGESDVGLVGPAVRDVRGRGMVGCGLTIADPETLAVAWLPPDGPAPHAVPMLCGMFTAMRREVFESVGGFDPGMAQWGEEDLELSLRLWLLGYRVLVVPQVCVGHLFRDAFPYPVDPVAVTANRIRLGMLHLDGERLARYLARLAAREGYEQALARALGGGVRDAAWRMRRIRRHDADWYLDRVAGAAGARA